MKSEELVYKTTIDENEYTLTIKFSKLLEKTDAEYRSFYSIFFKRMMGCLKFKHVRRSYFDPSKSV